MSAATSRRAILFDVDHTVLNTSLFHERLAHALGRILGIDAKTFLAERKNYDSDDHGYRLNDHLAKYDQKLSWLHFRLLIELTGKRANCLIYDDALRAMRLALAQPETDVWLVTTGDPETQAFKISLIERILKLNQISQVSRLKSKIISVGTHKGYWLAHQWQYGLAVAGIKYDRIVLVDDNPIHFRYLNDTPGFVGLQIRRLLENGGYRYDATEKSFIHFIKKLDEACDYLEKVPS